ncbi:MAG: DUF302 domain-containing protein [Actinobacteria bacterium]|nr:DUF302 domain-containing protein [Actinomycetota bacterium]
MTTRSHAHTHTMTRIDIDTGIEFGEFVAAFEAAAPRVDLEAVRRLIAEGGNWDDVRTATAANAPNGLMIYATIDATELFVVAGHSGKAMEYLLGNHVIAETMYRHDAKAMLYAPLRVLIHSNGGGEAVFTMDRPGDSFASLGNGEVSAVGEDLNRKVAALLGVIGVDAADAFGG